MSTVEAVEVRKNIDYSVICFIKGLGSLNFTPKNEENKSVQKITVIVSERLLSSKFSLHLCVLIHTEKQNKTNVDCYAEGTFGSYAI